MVEHIHKRHNKSLLVYHVVCPIKYRRNVFTEASEETLKQTCLELGMRYDIRFLEIGVDGDHAHFLIQAIPNRVGQYGNLAMLQNYVKRQGKNDYKQLHHQTLSLFDQGDITA